MPITFVESDTCTHKIAETSALQREHWDEIARNKHLMVLSPDIEQYRRIEQAGMLFAVFAYDGDRMIGYSINILSVNLHYSSLLMANNDLLFIAKEYRAGRVGVRLIEETKRLAAKRGARLMLWHAKEETPLAAILPRMGCTVQDIIYSQELAQSNFRMYGTFDVAAAVREQAGANFWDAFTARQDAPGSAHHDTRCIVLRGPDIPDGTPYSHDVAFNVLDSRDWETSIRQLPEVAALCVAACQRLRVKELGRVMLVELKPGGHIDRHADEGAYAEHFDRFHLALQSDAGNTFSNGAESIHMKPGELWKFDHRIDHEVFNHSATPRIHLIIDATTE